MLTPKCRPRGGILSAALSCRPRETHVSPQRTAVVCQTGPLGPFIPHQLGREWEGKSKESARPSTPLEPKWPRVACTAALYQPSPHPVGAVPPLGGGLGAPNTLGLPKPPFPEGGPPLRAHARTHPPAGRSGNDRVRGGIRVVGLSFLFVVVEGGVARNRTKRLTPPMGCAT